MTAYQHAENRFLKKIAEANIAYANRLEEENRILRNAIPMRRYFRHQEPRRIPALRVMRVKAVA